MTGLRRMRHRLGVLVRATTAFLGEVIAPTYDGHHATRL